MASGSWRATRFSFRGSAALLRGQHAGVWRFDFWLFLLLACGGLEGGWIFITLPAASIISSRAAAASSPSRHPRAGVSLGVRIPIANPHVSTSTRCPSTFTQPPSHHSSHSTPHRADPDPLHFLRGVQIYSNTTDTPYIPKHNQPPSLLSHIPSIFPLTFQFT